MNTYSRSSPSSGDLVSRRRDAIVALVSDHRIASQLELVRLLRKRGFRATQATLSRDLTSLGIGKRPSPEGAVYALSAAPAEVLDTRRRALEIEAFVQATRVVGNLVLVVTPPGNAHGVARAIDLFGWPEVAGSVAGDDTVLVVTETKAEALRFQRRLDELRGKSAAGGRIGPPRRT